MRRALDRPMDDMARRDSVKIWSTVALEVSGLGVMEGFWSED